MLSTQNADSAAEDARCLLAALVARPVIDEEDIQRFREVTYRRGKVDRRFAAELFLANRKINSCLHAWTELFLELMSGFFLQYKDGQYSLLTEKEALLLGWLDTDRSIKSLAERRLALRILLRSTQGADRLEQHILMAVLDNLLNQSECWLGEGERRPGEIDAMDMRFIRTLMDRETEGGALKSSRAMTTFLLAIEQNAHRFADPVSWRRLLVKGFLQHLSPERPVHADLITGASVAMGLSTMLDPDTHGTFGDAMGICGDSAVRERLYQELLAAVQFRA